ncbi:hypothetical protein VMCG_03585 [Cytospora schulzeri]|uniref:Uncharacterized protein n=1 Tax=Cytospora schulzeri TaxID=448051 RepID=A0A423WWF9_9PEZI|nr:hypothetical protein VMCG_03585 [Valsa malicola]
MDDRDGSTTPPLPPPEPYETQQPQQSSETLGPRQESSLSPPTSAQLEREDRPSEPAEARGHEASMDGTPQQSRLPRRANMSTPEPRLINTSNFHGNINPSSQTNGQGHENVANIDLAAHMEHERSSTPDTPGTVRTIPSFDWDDLEGRFEKALADVNGHEEDLMAEFEALVKYFNVWASAASAHDNERAAKRLQTRTQFVQLKEADLEKKKQYYEQVMQAFQNAMRLLNQA